MSWQRTLPRVLYLREFTSPEAIGEAGYLKGKGLIPLAPHEQEEMYKRAEQIGGTMRSLWVERAVRTLFMLCALGAVIITIGIVVSLIGEAFRFFARVNFFDFIFGLTWAPHTLETGENIGFGAIPLFTGTALITLIAMAVAVPCGVMVAIYLSEYASTSMRQTLKPLLETLAGIPTLVYGFFAAATLGPLLRDIAGFFNLTVASESALCAGVVMGIMILPYMSSLCEDALHSLPTNLREASMGLGATPSETIVRVLLPATFPSLMAAFLLSFIKGYWGDNDCGHGSRSLCKPYL